MTETIDILQFRQSVEIDDQLTALAREGARRILAEALAPEADAFVASFAETAGVNRTGFAGNCIQVEGRWR